MPKWRSIKPNDLIKALRRAGFIEKRQKGSHLIMSNGSGRIVVVPMHHGKDIPVGTLHAILRDANITPEQLEDLL